jgi:hypothetical protein
LLVRATLTLALMQLGIRMPFRTVARVMGLRDGETSELVDPDQRALATEVGWAIGTAAGHAPWRSTCLAEALAGAAMLRRLRVPTTMYMGVAKDGAQGDGLSAHAWLRCGDVVLTGAAERAQFTTIARFASTRRRQRVRPSRRRGAAGIGA